MKLLIAADIFPPQTGGPATYSVGLANAFTEQGIDVRIVSLTLDSTTTMVRCPISVVKNKHKIIRYFEYFWLLLREGRKVDGIYAMGPVNAGLPALVAAKVLRKKFVVKVVGDYAWEQGTQRFGVVDLMDDFQGKKFSGVVGWLQGIEHLTVRMADQVIVPSKYLQKIVVGWGALHDKVTVIYNAISLSKVQQAVPVSNKPTEEQWVVTVGRLVPWKGVKELIEIMTELHKNFPHAQLKVLGDGPDRSRLEKTITECQAQTFVELLGNVSHETVLSYMKSSDVLVLNSGYEGLSHVLVEALNLDCRILASAIGGNGEVVIPHETGDLFPYNEKTEIQKKIRLALGGTMPLPFSGSLDRGIFFKKFEFTTMIQETKQLLATLCAHS